METHQTAKGFGTEIVLNQQLEIIEVINPDQRILWGHSEALSCVGKSLEQLITDTSTSNLVQWAKLRKAIQLAVTEKRQVYEEYTCKLPHHQLAYVAAYIRNAGDVIRICALEIHAEDYQRTHETHTLPESVADFSIPFIYENMPIGLEIYDKNGMLIEMNSKEMELMGIKNKCDVLGLNLFENPNIPEELKGMLLAGKDIRSSISYDYDKARECYFDTQASASRYFELIIFIIRNRQGEVDKYLLIAQDETKYESLRKEVERLSNQTETILESLPVGVELYNADGRLIYLNNTDCRIFGVEKEEALALPIYIDNNPNLPIEVKEAVKNGADSHARFPYNFGKVEDTGFYTTTQTSAIRQIECNGKPVINSSGEVEKYIFIVEDVTESVQTEQELRQSKQKSQLAMQASEIMLWEFNNETSLFASENEALNNYNPQQLIRIDEYLAAFHPDDKKIAQDLIDRMLTGEDFTFASEMRMRYSDENEWQYYSFCGAPFERNEEGRIIKYVGSRKNNSDLIRQRMFQEKILNSIALPIHIKDMNDNCRYVFCNEESKRLFGTHEGQNVYDLVDEQLSAKIEQSDWTVFSTGKSYMGYERITLKDGRTYDIMVQKSVIYNGDKRLLLTVRWDQSVQNELERKTKVLSMSVNSLNAFTWYYDHDTKVLSFGEGFERDERDPQRVDSLQKFADCIHEEDRRTFVERMQQILLEDASEFSIDYRIDLLGDGNYEWWERRGVLETAFFEGVAYKYMYGMDINIMAHKEIELTLLANKKELDRLVKQNELVLNNTNSALAYITTDHVVQWENISNSSAEAIYSSYRTGECCYRTARGRSTPCLNCVMTEAVDTRRIARGNYSLDEEHVVEIFAIPVFSETDAEKVDGVVLRIDNVTERERMFAELKEAKRLAEQSDKLKSAFLANMSHEIRTPLNSIVGFSDLLMHSDEMEEKEEYMQIINTNNELLLKLISDILDLSKIEAGAVELKCEKFDFAYYFDSVASSMEQRMRNPDVQLVVKNPYKSCLIYSDRNRIVQILTNYLTNAIKYTPQGSIEMGYEMVAEGIRFYVKDSGIGIPDEKKNRVFHRFEKLDEFAQGTGLGLSICKAIAEAMGGAVGFESVGGEGSVFWAIITCQPEIS